MLDFGRADDQVSEGRPLAYTDTHLCYCPECTHKLGYDQKEKWGPNWLPFIPITTPDELPQKRCDSCDRPIKDLVE